MEADDHNRGGAALKEAIRAFDADRTEERFLRLLYVLRCSSVWIPCTAVLGAEDQAAVEQTLKEDPSPVGKTFTTREAIRMVPDILTDGKAFFFPVFSDPEAMGDYGSRFSKVERTMREAISLAMGNERSVAGIVVNPFTEPFVLGRELFGSMLR